MKLLLDHCVPRRLAKSFTTHQVATAADMQWGRLRNGALLAEAARAGFDALVTVDQNLKHQQNLAALPLAVVVLRSPSNDIDDLTKLVPLVLAALASLMPSTLIEVPAESDT